MSECFSVDFPTARPKTTSHFAIPRMPGMTPIYRGLRKVMINNMIPVITSTYDGWRRMKDLKFSTEDLIDNLLMRATVGVGRNDCLRQLNSSLRKTNGQGQGW
jgi:hypothetical protein